MEEARAKPGVVRSFFSDLGDALIQLGGYVMAAGFFVWAGVLLFQAYAWLRGGEWLQIPAGMPWVLAFGSLPNAGAWIGVQKVVDWLILAPLSVCGLVFGLGTGIAIVLVGAWMVRAASLP